MIEQLQFSLRTAETPRLPSAWAYRIYGWLMAQLPADTAARLHEQGEHPLSQSLCFDAAAQTSVWTLNLLDEALAAQVRPLLAGCTTLKLHGAPLQMEPLGSHSVENGLQLLLAARENPASRTRLWFRTPCAFKQAGRYAIYPQEFLLLQSLVLSWITTCTPSPIPSRTPASRALWAALLWRPGWPCRCWSSGTPCSPLRPTAASGSKPPLAWAAYRWSRWPRRRSYDKCV